MIPASIQVTPVYAALLGLFYFLLSLNVIRGRRKFLVALGSKDNRMMERFMRAHGNFSEYVPLCLLLLCMLEIKGASPFLLHSIGSTLLVGRIFHALGLLWGEPQKKSLALRQLGMLATFGCLLSASVRLLLI